MQKFYCIVARRRDVGHIDDEGEGGAATFDGKKPKVKEEMLEWRAGDLKSKRMLYRKLYRNLNEPI